MSKPHPKQERLDREEAKYEEFEHPLRRLRQIPVEVLDPAHDAVHDEIAVKFATGEVPLPADEIPTTGEIPAAAETPAAPEAPSVTPEDPPAAAVVPLADVEDKVVSDDDGIVRKREVSPTAASKEMKVRKTLDNKEATVEPEDAVKSVENDDETSAKKHTGSGQEQDEEGMAKDLEGKDDAGEKLTI